MNSLSFAILIISFVSSLGGLALVFAVISFISFIISIVLIGNTYDRYNEKEVIEEKTKMFKKYLKMAIVSFIISVSVVVLVPSEKTMWLILGSETGSKIYNSDDFKSVKDPALEIIRKQLQKQIESFDTKTK